MKITTELKNLIKRSFDEKRATVTREIKAVATDLYEEKKRKLLTVRNLRLM